MTLKEATEAATLMKPVIHQGIEYRRITLAGFLFDEYGRKSPVVRLKDKHANSFTWADPAKVEVKGGEWQ